MSAAVYLICTVLFSLSIAQILKVVELRKLRTLPVLVVNYAAAFLVASATSEWEGVFAHSDLRYIAVLSVIVGALFILNFLIYSKSIDRNGMGISIAGMRMSLVIPIGVSLFFYREEINDLKMAGVLISLLALFLLIPSFKRKGTDDWKVAILPVLLFLFTGLGETGLKVFEREFSGSFSQSQFLSGIFLTAFLIGAIVMFIRSESSLTTGELLAGTVLGVVNLYSSHFLILALKSYPGSIVFPVVNLATIVGGTAIGLYFWNDKVSQKQWFGLVLALISIYLLL